MKTTTARSRKLMEDRGYQVELVEHYNGHTMRRHDLFGIFDLLCIHKDTGEVAAVQSTSASNTSSRVNKIVNSDNLSLVRRAGWKIWVHGWKRGTNGRYTVREEDIS
jgi:hypothetical protein